MYLVTPLIHTHTVLMTELGGCPGWGGLFEIPLPVFVTQLHLCGWQWGCWWWWVENPVLRIHVYLWSLRISITLFWIGCGRNGRGLRHQICLLSFNIHLSNENSWNKNSVKPYCNRTCRVVGRLLGETFWLHCQCMRHYQQTNKLKSADNAAMELYILADLT